MGLIVRISSAIYPITVLDFDRYDDMSANDHERMRRVGVGSTAYKITTTHSLPNRDAILKNKYHKRELSWVLSLINLGINVTMDNRDDGVFTGDETDVTMKESYYKLKNLVRM